MIVASIILSWYVAVHNRACMHCLRMRRVSRLRDIYKRHPWVELVVLYIFKLGDQLLSITVLHSFLKFKIYIQRVGVER